MRRLVLVLTGLVASAGCELAVSTSGLSGGGATSPEGGSDAPVSDGSVLPSNEGGLDGSTSCTHTLCDDFDRSGAVTDGWMPELVPGGTIAFSTAQALSAPNSFLAMIPARAAGTPGTTYAVLRRTIGPSNKKLHLQFDFFLPTPAWSTGDSTVGILCFGYRGDSGYQALCLSAANGNAGFGNTGIGALPASTWTHLDVTMTTTNATLVVGVGGTPTTIPLMTGTGGAPDGTYVELGILGYNDPTPAFSIYYDNVIADLE